MRHLGYLIAVIVFTFQQEQFKQYSFSIYIMSASFMFLALALFVLGRNSYTTFPPIGSFLVDYCKIIWYALRCLVCRQMARGVQPETWLDRSKRIFGGPFFDMQVEDVKVLLKTLPIFLVTVVFWGISYQVKCSI